jgi:hypothetical protein
LTNTNTKADLGDQSADPSGKSADPYSVPEFVKAYAAEKKPKLDTKVGCL